MILPEQYNILEAPETVSSKEVFLEDIDKTLSYPGDMHDADISFHAKINEYGKSPLQAMREVIEDKSLWERKAQEFEKLEKAVPKFVSGMGISMLMQGSIPTKEGAEMLGKAQEDVAESIEPIIGSLFETFIGRFKEPIRQFIGDIVTNEPLSERPANILRAAIEPSSVKKITGPEVIPLAEWERNGGIVPLIPRAILNGIEDVFVYSVNFNQLPQMVEKYQINAGKNLVQNNIEKFVNHVTANSPMTEVEAMNWLSQPNVLKFVYNRVNNPKGITKFYTAPALPEDLGAAAKAIGETVGKKGIAKAGGKLAAETLKKGFKERSFVNSIKEEKPQVKVSGQYVPRSTDELAIKARNQIVDNIAVAEKMAKTGLDDASIATGAELLKYYCEEAAKASSPAVADTLYEKAAELGNNMAERLTELGRSVQAASILSRLTPEGQLRFAAKTIQKYNEQVEKSSGLFGLKKKIPELTPEQSKDIINKIDEIKFLPDGEEKAIKYRDLQNYISDLVPTPLFKKIVTIWKVGLLTGLKTSGVNILSNVSHAIGTEVLKDIPATAVDTLVSLFTKKRTKAATVKGLTKGVKEGFQKGVRFLKTGYDERNVLAKLDYERVSFGKNKFAKGLQAYTDFIFKILGAEDQPFYYGAKARSIAEQAIVAAKNKGLKGKEATKYANDLMDNPTDDMLTLAVADAEIAVYQNPTELSKAGSAIRKGVPISEFLLPFTKTPSAVAMQIINYSPIGIAKTIITNIGKGKFNQKAFSEGIGRGLTGIGVLAIGVALARKGLVALDRPKTEKEQKMWELEGKKPNSVKVGDKWRSIQVLGPAGNLLLIGAQFDQAFATSGSPTEAIAIAMANSSKSFTEQTFLTGLSSGIEAITDPQRSAAKFAGQTISSFIPTIVADIAKATDKYERRSNSISERVAARIPILRQTLEPQIDILGKERMIKENFLETMVDPTRPATEQNDPVVIEMRRLIDEGNDLSTSQVGDRKGYSILSKSQNTELLETAGSVAYDKILSYMDMGNYENTPDDQKAKDINKIIEQAKIMARVEKVIEITEGLEGEELMQTLSEAKKSGLLNREVLEWYKRLR